MRNVLLLVFLSGHLIFGSSLLLLKESYAAKVGQTHPATQVVTLEKLGQVLLKDLGNRAGSDKVQLHVRMLFPKKAVTVPQGPLTFQVNTGPLGIRTGRRAFRIALYRGSILVKRIHVVAEVTAEADVVLPIRWIKPHEVIQPEDLLVRSLNLTTLGQDFIMNPFHAIGKKSLRSLPPNQPIRRSQLAVPPVIHRGDRVMIEAQRGGLQIQTVGTAKASGQVGQTIPVENRASGREVLGKVLRGGVVEVPF